MQTAIACMLMRGGTSKGLFFRAQDLPTETTQRDRVLLAAMGSPDPRQIDGGGGAHPLTSKVGIVGVSDKPGIDLEFLFAQLQPASNIVDTTPNCGNMLAAVVPFALESGLISARGENSSFRVLTLNTNMVADISVLTPNGYISYSGNTRIDGVPGTAAPIEISFLDTAGSVCPALLPTGQPRDHVTINDGDFPPFSVEVTCIDNGMPLVIIQAAALGISGLESTAELNKNTALKQRLEALRLYLGPRMGLGDVKTKNYPKMTLISPPQQGGSLSTRSFIPHVCHEAIGVLAAVTVASAIKIPGTVCAELVMQHSAENNNTVSIEHPSGEFSVRLETDPLQPQRITRAALLRTARLIMRGEVMVPKTIWTGL